MFMTITDFASDGSLRLGLRDFVYGGDKTLPCRNGWSAEKVAEEIRDKNTIEILKRSSKDKKN